MGTPAEVLQAFWQELRGRTRVTIGARWWCVSAQGREPDHDRETSDKPGEKPDEQQDEKQGALVGGQNPADGSDSGDSSEDNDDSGRLRASLATAREGG
jgi:hypothetical protein